MLLRKTLKAYVDFTGTNAFRDEVVAYPAVTVIQRGSGTRTLAAFRPEITEAKLTRLAHAFSVQKTDDDLISIEKVVSGREPWLLTNLQLIAEIRKLEDRFPAIEEAKCKVGIGVATGADRIYIGSNEELAIEEELKLPILTTRDVTNGKIEWRDRYVFNPFLGNTSKLVDPDRYPKLKTFLEKHRAVIEKRHVAKKNPGAWFKTIDRIYPSLVNTPKLMIPDIKGEAEVILDNGEFYPHHNLYYITTEDWDLYALQAVMLSPIAKAFVSCYSLRMRGDCLRFQAQYLRRIRLPRWDAVALKLREELMHAARIGDQKKSNEVLKEIYGLSNKVWETFEAA